MLRLTVKLRGRAQVPDRSRGRTISARACGDATAHHGPLQRLLDVEPDEETQLSVEWPYLPWLTRKIVPSLADISAIATPPRHPGGSEPSTVHTPFFRVARYGFSESIGFLP